MTNSNESKATANKLALRFFYNIEKYLRKASTFRYWTWYGKLLYKFADTADSFREYFSQKDAKEVLHG